MLHFSQDQNSNDKVDINAAYSLFGNAFPWKLVII